MKKKTLALTLAVGAFLMTTGCTSTAPAPKTESTRYTAYGRYHTHIEVDNKVIEGVKTHDGHIWEYHADTISDKTPTDAMPVWVGFDDNGTPADITDDIILGLVYDRNTAIYDELETALSDAYELERNNNNIHIKGVK
jgi:hypothetical protein